MSDTAFVLIVEEEESRAEALAAALREEGHACHVVHTPAEAVESLQRRRPDVIIADTHVTGVHNGREFLRESSRLAPDAEIIVFTRGDEQPLARRARAGESHIYGFVQQDAPAKEISRVVARAAEQARRNREQRILTEQAENRVELDGIITANEYMIRLLRRLQRVADSKLTVLLLGESGTGKELAARAIHAHSPRRNRPYRAINCAGLNENLLESELFGHVKGAFTGADRDRKGLFEVVDGGTLFLDEVGDMPMAMQAKLLRTLDLGEIIPVGSSDVRRVDVRVVAATRQDVRAMVEAGKFRDDLYYRLTGATLRMPPLRERREDIPLLVDHFIRLAARIHQKDAPAISPDVVRRLTNYDWPGNIRELRSVIEEMVVLAERPRLELEDLPDRIRGNTELMRVPVMNNMLGLTMEQMEKLHIANTLKLTGGNREKTAKLLGIGARTLYRKLREYGL